MYDWDKDVPAGDFLGEIGTYWQKEGGGDWYLCHRKIWCNIRYCVWERERESHIWCNDWHTVPAVSGFTNCLSKPVTEDNLKTSQNQFE